MHVNKHASTYSYDEEILIMLSPSDPQALPLLKAQFPIERARMRLKLSAPLVCKEQLLEMADSYNAVVESVVDQQSGGGSTSVIVQVGREQDVFVIIFVEHRQLKCWYSIMLFTDPHI